jgi:hypothetical protein
MEERVRQDIISILDETVRALKSRNSMLLRDLSDHTLHNASIYQDKDSITIAVAIYALSKIIDRLGKEEPAISKIVLEALVALKKQDPELYEQCMKRLIDRVALLDSRLNLYIQKVINEAEIKKGSRLYEHGISLAQTADLLGITQWELMKYLGQTKIADRFVDKVSPVERLSHARRLFGL